MTTSTSSEPIAQLRTARDHAADTRNLARTLELDNELEHLGQLGHSPRRTCAQCRDWANHVHDPRTGARMLVHGSVPADRSHAPVALEVFDLAANALPHQWAQVGTFARAVVDLGAHQFVLVVHPGDGSDAHPRDAYIFGCVHRASGRAVAFPAVHAPWDRTGAIIAAYRHARRAGMPPAPAAIGEPVGTVDADDVLRRLRIRHSEIDAEIDSHTSHPDDDGHRERLAALYRDAVALADILDGHLTGGGRMPGDWAHATTG